MASNPPNPSDDQPASGNGAGERPTPPPPGQRVPPFVNRGAAPGGAQGTPAQRPTPPRPAGGAEPGQVAASAPVAAGSTAVSGPGSREALAAAAARTGPAPALAAAQQQLVYVWPHLVLIEFLASVLMLLSLLLMSTFVNAPLIGHANPDKTPNPSKAPWYFLNLQELLLHMHPALAGVIVPAAVVFVLIPLIPYLDRDTRDVGKWFGTAKAVPVTIFSAIFTSIVIPLEIFFDEYIGVKPLMLAIFNAIGLGGLTSSPLYTIWVVGVIVPSILMLGPIWVLLRLLHWIYRPLTIRDVMIALFTGFVVAYVLLTIFGTFFRGQGMHLYWLGDPRLERLD